MRKELEALATQRDRQYRTILSAYDQIVTIVSDIFGIDPLDIISDVSRKGFQDVYDMYYVRACHMPNTDAEYMRPFEKDDSYDDDYDDGWSYPFDSAISVKIVTRDKPLNPPIGRIDDYYETALIDAEIDTDTGRWKVDSGWYPNLAKKDHDKVPKDPKIAECMQRIDELFERLNAELNTNGGLS